MVFLSKVGSLGQARGIPASLTYSTFVAKQSESF